MPFQYVLANLLADNPDAIGALFLDGSGETVDFACAHSNPYEMQLLGAYLGIYVRRISDIAAVARLGATRLFHLERRNHDLHVIVLADGYYLVLVQRHPAQVGRARQSLQQAAAHMIREVL